MITTALGFYLVARLALATGAVVDHRQWFSTLDLCERQRAVIRLNPPLGAKVRASACIPENLEV